MTERDIRIAMLPKWRDVQAKFIELCGGDFEAMQRREPERQVMEAALIAEYHHRAASLTTV